MILHDQPYPAAAGRSNVYDLYAPLDYREHPYPIFIWMHGGGWSVGGDKADWLSWGAATHLALLGFVVLDVNYVVATPDHPAPYPASTDDIAAFNRYVARNEALFNSTAATRVSIGGHSAGGHLALYQATAPDAPFHYACVIDVAGIADLTALPYSAQLARYAQAFVPTAEARLAASPRYRLKDWRADHLLLIHSIRDPVVPVSQSQDVGTALGRLATPPSVHYVLLPRGDHDLPSRITNAAFEAFLGPHCR